MGKGAMGTVYATVESALNRKVAVKVLHPNLDLDTEMYSRFEREAQVLSQLTHQNIVAVYRMGNWRDSSYVAMEQLDGESLEARLRNSGKMSSTSALELAAEIASGLAVAHRAGIVHRDLKPANIFITQAGVVKILDFGLCRDIRSDQEVQKLTATGILIGSVHYMSPEACAGLAATPLSDIYALGIILYECLTGNPPFSSDTPLGTLYLHRHHPLPPLKAADTDRSSELNRLLSKCLAKEPSSRFQNMEALQDKIVKVLSKAPKEVRSEKVAWTGIFVLVLLTAVAMLITPKLNERKAAEHAATASGSVKTVNYQTLGASASKPIITEARHAAELGNTADGIKILDEHLSSPKLKTRPRILMLLAKSELSPRTDEILSSASKAFDLADKELAKGDDTDSNHLFFAAGMALQRALIFAGRNKEAEAVLDKLLSVEKSVGYGGSRLGNIVASPNTHQLRIARSELALSNHDLKTATKMANKIVADDFGDMNNSAQTAKLLLKLKRDKDVAKLIASINANNNSGPFEEYTSTMAVEQLIEVGITCSEFFRGDLALAALERANQINSATGPLRIGGVGAKWLIGVEKSKALYRKGAKAEADAYLLNLSAEWLALNKDGSKGEYALHNPLPLIVTLLKHGFTEQAKKIMVIAESKIQLYAAKLDFHRQLSFAQHKQLLLEILEPYSKDPVIAEFREPIKKMPAPTRE